MILPNKQLRFESVYFNRSNHFHDVTLEESLGFGDNGNLFNNYCWLHYFFGIIVVMILFVFVVFFVFVVILFFCFFFAALLLGKDLRLKISYIKLVHTSSGID